MTRPIRNHPRDFGTISAKAAMVVIALLALFYHAWVGMRDIWMDYLRGTAIRLICETLTIIWLVGCAGYALQILWSE